jgi:DNA modification methylase
MIDLRQGDCLALMKTLADNSVDIIFTDPPYALGSEVIIKPNGKPDYKKAVDFMSKWEQPNGDFWEQWFIEAKRILKHGGRVLMFGIDRQLMLNCYYATAAGFVTQQSLYWYTIQGFPKATDCSLSLDRHFKAKRDCDGGYIPNNKNKLYGNGLGGGQTTNITTPATELAKKYDGFKYGVAVFKQTNEVIMVFQKPCKTGSPLHDILAMEAGDDTITASIVDIENNKVEIKLTDKNIRFNAKNHIHKKDVDSCTYDMGYSGVGAKATQDLGYHNSQGRFPAQTFVDSAAAEVLDRQSGVCGGHSLNTKKVYSYEAAKNTFKPLDRNPHGYNDTNVGGCSKILHKCDYDKGDYDIYHYCPKVSSKERNEGLEGFEKKRAGSYNGAFDDSLKTGSGNARNQQSFNDHPTVKPIALLTKIAKLFKTPNKQVMLDCFVGSGTAAIAAHRLGYDFIGFEKDNDFFNIAQARVNHEINKPKQDIL